MAVATAQVNVRINPQLKSQGDEGLAAAGITPTQAVRAVWELAAQNKNTPDRLKAVLFPGQDEVDSDEVAAQKQYRSKLIEEGSLICEQAYKQIGLNKPYATTDLSYAELKEAAYFEKYGVDKGQYRENSYHAVFD